jgi:hypothetical protein
MRVPKWLYDPRPAKKLLRTPRQFTEPAQQSRQLAVIPETISSKDLPQRVRTIVAKHLWLVDYRRRYPDVDPSLAHNGKYRSGAHTTPPVRDIEGNEILSVPNPFLRMKYAVESFSPFDVKKPAFNYRQLINRRNQLVLLARHKPYTLPPSPTNPISTVPRIKWEEAGPWKGAVLNWKGEWEPKVAKGIYANRSMIFKGKKREREREARQAEIKDRMETMEERVTKWKDVSIHVIRHNRSTDHVAKAHREEQQTPIVTFLGFITMYAYITPRHERARCTLHLPSDQIFQPVQRRQRAVVAVTMNDGPFFIVYRRDVLDFGRWSFPFHLEDNDSSRPRLCTDDFDFSTLLGPLLITVCDLVCAFGRPDCDRLQVIGAGIQSDRNRWLNLVLP